MASTGGILTRTQTTPNVWIDCGRSILALLHSCLEGTYLYVRRGPRTPLRTLGVVWYCYTFRRAGAPLSKAKRELLAATLDTFAIINRSVDGKLADWREPRPIVATMRNLQVDRATLRRYRKELRVVIERSRELQRHKSHVLRLQMSRRCRERSLFLLQETIEHLLDGPTLIKDEQHLALHSALCLIQIADDWLDVPLDRRLGLATFGTEYRLANRIEKRHRLALLARYLQRGSLHHDATMHQLLLLSKYSLALAARIFWLARQHRSSGKG